MNRKEIIESGILESYALGIASDEERRQVELLLSTDETLREELNKIEEALFKYASSHAVMPPDKVKENLFEKLDFKSPVILEPKKNNNAWYYAIAASVALLIVSAALNYSLINKLKESDSKNNQMTVQMNDIKTHSTEMEKNHQKEIADLSSQLNRKIILKGVDKFPPGSVTVYWNEKTNEVTLFVNNLPRPPTGKQYQLWALKDGKPIDAGMIDSFSDTLLQKMKEINGAQAFAITLEKEGGVPSPTLSEMYVMGNM